MNLVFIALDGDSVGKLIEKLILNEDELNLSRVSRKIELAISNCSERSRELGAEVIFGAGDNILIKCDNSREDNIIEAFLKETDDLPIKFSIGVGDSMINAYLALKLAKIRQIGIHSIKTT